MSTGYEHKDSCSQVQAENRRATPQRRPQQSQHESGSHRSNGGR